MEDIRKMVKVFFKGTTDDVNRLKKEHPKEFEGITNICELQK